MRAKESVLQAIHRLPDDVDFHAIAEEIAFLAALEQGPITQDALLINYCLEPGQLDPCQLRTLSNRGQ